MDYSKRDDPDQEDGVKEDEEVESKLHPDVKELVDVICDFKAMEKYLRKMNFDTNRTPLGEFLSFLQLWFRKDHQGATEDWLEAVVLDRIPNNGQRIRWLVSCARQRVLHQDSA